MHKSKLAGFIIDCKTDDPAGAADFWAAALGMETRAAPAEDGIVLRLSSSGRSMNIWVQT